MSKSKIKIMIADDHAVVRKGLRQILIENYKNIKIEEASNGIDALDKILKNTYDAVILDISMPGLSGLEAMKRIKKKKPTLPVLILSMHPEEQYAIRVIRAGALGYLTKDSASEELVNALISVCSGRRYITSSLADKLASLIEGDYSKPLHSSLSDREYQITCMIANGKSVNDISNYLGISSKTISSHRARILYKLKLNNNSELAVYAIKNKLID
jgi:DNA-binding NarL/FixJ family response regulator